MEGKKPFGLVIPKKTQALRPNSGGIFGSDSDDDASTSKKKSTKIPQSKLKSSKHITSKEEIDPSIYEYDSIYDDMKAEKAAELAPKVQKSSRYIDHLLKAADKRKKEYERRVEKKVQVEREKEGDKFKDKEMFVTAAYKKKVQEREEEEERERRENMLNDMMDVTKQKDLSGFYRHFLKQTVGEEKIPVFGERTGIKEEQVSDTVSEEHLLDREMEVIDEMFDDLKFAQAAMRKWLKSTSVEFTKQQENMMLKLFNHIRSTVDLFDTVAESASIYNEMDANLLKSAMLRYHKGLTKNTHSYKMLFHRLKEDLDGECEDTFRTGVRGILKVSHDERMELGELEDGLEECKRECIEEPKCRAIGYADHYPVLEYDESTRDFKIVRKEKQCWLYFRSSRTTTLIPAETEAVTKIYDRYCY